MNRDQISKTEAFLRRSYAEGEYLSAHPDALRYRLGHSFRVANLGREIARREGFDETELVIACLLHDLSYCESFGEGGWQEHGRRSAALARPFLHSLGLPEVRVADICYGIAIHVDDAADFPGERTPFALSVADADNLDRFDVYRIHELLEREGFLRMAPEAQLSFARTRLSRLGELAEMPMGTETARLLWRERLAFGAAFYERLAAQLESSGGILE